MKKVSRAALAALALLFVGYGACRLVGSSPVDPEADPKLLFGRAWIDKAPEKPTDKIQAFAAIEKRAEGLFFHGSAYEARFERFGFERDKNELRLVFPQDGRKAKIKYEVKTCNEVDGFDLCLDLSQNPWGGPKRYYGSTKSDALPPAAQQALEAAER